MSLFTKRRTVSQPQGLISVLLDENAEYGDRDDAAMDLGAFDEPQAEDGLICGGCFRRGVIRPFGALLPVISPTNRLFQRARSVDKL